MKLYLEQLQLKHFSRFVLVSSSGLLVCLLARTRQGETVNHCEYPLQILAMSGDSRYLLKHAERESRLLSLNQCYVVLNAAFKWQEALV